MRILVVLPSLRPESRAQHVGGGEISNRLLLEGLAARGHEVKSVSIYGGGFGSVVDRCIEYVELRDAGYGLLGIGWSYYRYPRRVLQVARRFRPDIVVTGTSVLAVGVSVAAAVGVPCGMLVRSLLENFSSRLDSRPSITDRVKVRFREALLGRYRDRAVCQADFLLVNSRAIERECRAVVGDMRMHVVYPPMNVQSVLPMRRGALRAISMVATSMHKGVALAIELAKRMPSIEFRLVGMPASLQRRIHPRSNVRIVGWCDVVQEFSANADLVIVPSLIKEAFGRVAVEALVSGVPLLVSDIGGLPEVVGFDDRLTVQAGNVEAWHRRILEVSADMAEFSRRSRKAQAALGAFSAERQVEVLETVLKDEIQRAVA